MHIGRFQAYLIIALVGYVVGIVFYYLGKIIGNIVRETFPVVVNLLRRPEISGILVSGIVGMTVAVILAYIWAERYSRIA